MEVGGKEFRGGDDGGGEKRTEEEAFESDGHEGDRDGRDEVEEEVKGRGEGQVDLGVGGRLV